MTIELKRRPNSWLLSIAASQPAPVLEGWEDPNADDRVAARIDLLDAVIEEATAERDRLAGDRARLAAIAKQDAAERSKQWQEEQRLKAEAREQRELERTAEAERRRLASERAAEDEFLARFYRAHGIHRNDPDVLRLHADYPRVLSIVNRRIAESS